MGKKLMVFTTCKEAIHAALAARGLTVQWLRTSLGKGFSFYQTLERSHGMALADRCFGLLGVKLFVDTDEVKHDAQGQTVAAETGSRHRRQRSRRSRGAQPMAD